MQREHREGLWASRRIERRNPNPNTRCPSKDGYYGHGKNCVESVAQMFGPGAKLKPAMKVNPMHAYPPSALS